MAAIPSRASNDNATISAGVRLGIMPEVYTKRLEIALSGTRRERRAPVLGTPRTAHVGALQLRRRTALWRRFRPLRTG
jgi:hypothetical protein